MIVYIRNACFTWKFEAKFGMKDNFCGDDDQWKSKIWTHFYQKVREMREREREKTDRYIWTEVLHEVKSVKEKSETESKFQETELRKKRMTFVMLHVTTSDGTGMLHI